MANTFWGKKVLCIISGASRGFGKALAIEFAKRFIEISQLSGQDDQTHSSNLYRLSFILTLWHQFSI